MIRFAILFAIFFSHTISVFSQTDVDTSKQNAYTRTINQRADKIVAALGIKNAKKSIIVRDIISNQYRNLNDIHTSRDNKLKEAKIQLANNKEAQAAATKKIEEEATARLDSLHSLYLAALSSKLTKDQVIKVKDGMTYGVVPITYNGYLQMILTLNEEQKKKIMDWLVEAREHAMDAESSDKKHAWFGKYKGRINNYLSAAGYDLRKEGDDWTKRRNAEKTAASNK